MATPSSTWSIAVASPLMSEWPSLTEDFVLTEGDGFAWFRVDDAVMLRDILDLARDDLLVFRERVVTPGAG